MAASTMRTRRLCEGDKAKVKKIIIVVAINMLSQAPREKERNKAANIKGN